MIKKILLTFSFILFFLFGQAQNVDFHQYTKQDGLSQSVIICTFQDSYGYLWFGTQNGLNRFDGYEFKTFLHNPYDSTTISNNWIFSVVEDNNKDLWIGTKDGLNKYNRTTGEFERITYKESENKETKDYVYGLFVNSKGDILINDEMFFYLYNHEAKVSQTYCNKLVSDYSVNDFTLPIYEDSKNNIWIATTNGLVKFNSETQKLEYFNAENEELSSNIVYSIYEDSNNSIFVGTDNGLNILNPKTNAFKQIYYNKYVNSNDNFIYSIGQDSYNNYWLGTNNGLLKMKIKKNGRPDFSLINTTNSFLSHNIVYSVFIDNNDNLWAGTLKEISKADLKPKKFKLYQNNNTSESIELLDNLIASIYKQNDSIIWIGNWGKGLNIVNRNSGKVTYYSSEQSGNNYISNDFVHCILKNHKKDIWIGTRDGLFVFDPDTEVFVRLSQFYNNSNIPNLEEHRILKIIQDYANNYWIATENGVYWLDENGELLENFTSENEHNKITGNLIYDVLEDYNYNIWFATSTGLTKYDRKAKRTYLITRNEKMPENTLCDNFVVSLCEDRIGNLWIGTQSGANYFNVNDSSYTHYSTHNGLPDKLIYTILMDKNNDIWFATGFGLARYDSDNREFVNYTLFDGLQSVEFNLNAVHKSYDDEIFFGGMNGVNSFYTDSIFFNTKIPKIVFTDFVVKSSSGDRDIPVTNLSEIELSRKDYEFTVKFSALDYTFPALNQYAYKIIGINDEWVEIDKRRFVTFSNLPPGDYTLVVKGSNNDGTWNEEGRSIRIIIKPPFWRTTFAYILYFIVLAFLIFLIIKLRERNLVREREILEQKVHERTQIISQQKAKIEKAHTEITDSIDYAAKIQSAILPKKESLKVVFNEHFIFYLPKHTVSGDFFYVKEINKFKVFLVADCTGHGVPGAFLSMLGISLLNDIIPRREITTASQILEEMRSRVKTILQQHIEKSETKDGMDMSICIYNKEEKHVQFSGANTPLYVVTNKKEADLLKCQNVRTFEDENIPEKILIEYIPTKNPVGIFVKEVAFEDCKIICNPNQTFYIFSDGYADQFSAGGKKFTSTRFKQLLLNISDLTLKEQKNKLQEEYQNWKGNSRQIDDIIVLGIRV